MKDAIIVNNLTKYYGNFLAVDHISFSVRSGEIFGFLGPNGAGKTTTIRMLCGLIKISEGEAKILGHDVKKETNYIKKLIGVVPDISNLYWDLTTYDNLMFSAEMYRVPRSERKKRVKELIHFFGLDEKIDTKFKDLSKGLKRRAVIAAALVHKPKILFLDEPTIGLDVKSKRQIWKLIRELNSNGLTIFLTTHNIYEAFRLCDRIAIINKGRIIAIGTPSELRTRVSESRVIELQTNPPLELDLISRLPGIIKATKEHDNTIRITISDAILALESIVDVIKKHELEILMLNLRGANAEEVFIQLIEQRML